MNYAPIVLFVYNRPEHTRKTIEALQKNNLANESELFIYADGAKDAAAAAGVQAVREYIATIEGFKNITIIEQKENKGLAESIVGGVTEIVNRYGKIIVLEDDIVTSPYFLQYMNDALDLYQDAESVMHVSGYFYPHEETLPETFFYNQMQCWGWATWQRAWQHLELDVDTCIEVLQESHHRKKLYNRIALSTLRANKRGDTKTWAAFWHASVTKQQGFCLTPDRSLTTNSGHDTSGVHSQTTTLFDVVLADRPVEVTAIPPEENQQAVQAATKILRQTIPSLWVRLKNKFW